MKLRSVRIKNFRKLSRPTAISSLTDGVNVIAGCNEAGKSTVLSAIQTALFQRHNAPKKLVEAMQPFGSTVRPEIEIVFELHDGGYKLTKIFGASGGRAELVMPGGRRFADHDADAKLEELLRFQMAKNRESKFPELGYWPLFWVEQGTTFQGMSINPDVRVNIQSALQKEVGDMLVGEGGARLKQRIGEAYKELWTPATVKPREAHAETIKEVVRLEATLAAKRMECISYDDLVARYEEELIRLERLRDPAVQKAVETEAAAAEAEHVRVQALEQKQAEGSRDLQLATASLRESTAALQLRTELIDDAVRRDHQLGEVRKKLIAVEEGRRALSETLAAATRAAADVEAAQKSRQLLEAEAAQLAKDEAARIVNGIRVSQADVDRLKQQQTAFTTASARLEAASTKIHFELTDAAGITLNGSVLPAENPVLITDEAVIHIPGRGSLRISPGGDSLTGRRAEFESSGGLLRQTLEALQVASLEEAETQSRSKLEASLHLAAHTDALGRLAPGGIERLREEVALYGPGTVPAENADAGQLRAAQDRLENARRQWEASASSFAALESDQRNAQLEWQRAQEKLAAARATAIDQDLQAARVSHQAAVESRTRAFAEADAAYRSANPDAARQRLLKAKAAFSGWRDELQQAGTDHTRTLGRLEEAGAAGLGEQCANLEAELNAAREKRDRIVLEAGAIRLLYQTILAAESNVNEKFLEPVIQRVQPYLNQVLPDSRIQFSNGMVLAGLQRGSVMEPYESLSVGAREQLSVIARIAFADLLAEQGITAPIILDDALVYSDDDRFTGAMKAIGEAGKRHQILILTCHEARYRALGYPVAHLED